MKLSIISVAVLLVGLLEPSLCFPQVELKDNPLPNIPNTYGAIYKGSHEGNANTYAETDTDSRGFGSSNMQAGLQGSGKLRGSVMTGGPEGNKAAGSYFGDMEGQGTMTADTQSISTDQGSYSRTATKGLLSGTGKFSGGSSSGSTGLSWK
ncbi:uncharacterized protein [Palaemon carinicauda]|uniref:uncharacterized protein isoform X3 n=1 Tax=Palaemon carinicauda TaxID=392227 RepID=UPI0035B5933E